MVRSPCDNNGRFLQYYQRLYSRVEYTPHEVSLYLVVAFPTPWREDVLGS